jgi:predicted metal-dependent phosphoesterase TrpH
MAVNLAPSVILEKPAAQDIAALRQVFATVHAASCPLSYNFHMHTVHSDGQLQPEAVVQQMLDRSLKGFAITDHHSVIGYRAAQCYLDTWQQNNPDDPSPHLWTGMEITSILLEIEVHILGFGFNPDHLVLTPYQQGTAPEGDAAQAANVISAIRQAGGLAVLAHPARYRRPLEEVIPAAVRAGIDGVETFYAYNNPKPWQPSPQETELVQQLSNQYRLLNSCGTDTHGLSLLQRL